MPVRNEVYVCETCGNVVDMVVGAKGVLYCCGMPMVHQKEKTEDKGMEKHVPVVQKVEGGFMVKVGSIPHPMEAEHHIVMIEIFEEDGKMQRMYLKPGEEAQAFFRSNAAKVTAREYCNLHGLWNA